MVVGAGLVYSFTPRQDRWSGLDLFVAVHSGSPKNSQSGRQKQPALLARIFTSSGDLIRTASIELTRIYPNQWLPMRFPAIRNSAGRQFMIELSLSDHKSTVLSFMQGAKRSLTQRAIHRALRELGIRLRGGQLYCREYYGELTMLGEENSRDRQRT